VTVTLLVLVTVALLVTVTLLVTAAGCRHRLALLRRCRKRRARRDQYTAGSEEDGGGGYRQTALPETALHENSRSSSACSREGENERKNLNLSRRVHTRCRGGRIRRTVQGRLKQPHLPLTYGHSAVWLGGAAAGLCHPVRLRTHSTLSAPVSS
jgi:hypothetical protein